MSSRISKYPGAEVTQTDLKKERYLLTSYRTEFRYAWSSGVATGRFLGGLRQGEIWGRRCDVCYRILVPPRMYCERCYVPTARWVRLMDTGRVVTYSVSYVNSDASRRKEPILVAVVEIDRGAGDRPQLLLRKRQPVGDINRLAKIEVEVIFEEPLNRE